MLFEKIFVWVLMLLIDLPVLALVGVLILVCFWPRIQARIESGEKYVTGEEKGGTISPYEPTNPDARRAFEEQKRLDELSYKLDGLTCELGSRLEHIAALLEDRKD